VHLLDPRKLIRVDQLQRGFPDQLVRLIPWRNSNGKCVAMGAAETKARTQKIRYGIGEEDPTGLVIELHGWPYYGCKVKSYLFREIHNPD